jgi:glycosyltransferase involved in cell wall biosynthesis
VGFAADVRRLGTVAGRNLATATLGLRRGGEAGLDLVHAVGPRSLTVAALGSSLPVVYSPLGRPGPRDVRWLRAVMGYRRVDVVCPTATLRRTLVERGVPIGRCHLVRPGVDFARVRRRRDAALRERLGFAEDDRVLLAAGESGRSANHVEAAWAAIILHLLDPRYRLLIWGRGAMVPHIRRFADGSRQPRVLTIAEARLGAVDYESLLPATDAVLLSSTGAVPTLPIAIAMAAALPVVATVTRTTSELLEDRHTALMTPPGRPRQLARRVMDLYEDSRLQWSIADMARTEAYEYFAQTRFLNQYRQLYQQVAEGRDVSVPEQAAGVGLQFHGVR